MKNIVIFAVVIAVIIVLLVIVLFFTERARRKLTAGVMKKMIDAMIAQDTDIAGLAAPSTEVALIQADAVKDKIALSELRKKYERDGEGNVIAEDAVVQMDWAVTRAHWKLIKKLIKQLQTEKAAIPASLLARKMTPAEKKTT